MKIRKALKHFGDIIVRSSLADFTFKNSDSLVSKQGRLLEIIGNQKEIFHTISKGVFETTIVISALLKDELLEIFKNFYPENLNFFIAKKGDIPLTGIITISYKDKVSVWMGSPKITVDGVSPNYILHWEGIRWACNNNYKFFEILGASDQTLFAFKSKFNGEIIPFYSMKWYSPLNRFIISIYNGLYPRHPL